MLLGADRVKEHISKVLAGIVAYGSPRHMLDLDPCRITLVPIEEYIREFNKLSKAYNRLSTREVAQAHTENFEPIVSEKEIEEGIEALKDPLDLISGNIHLTEFVKERMLQEAPGLWEEHARLQRDLNGQQEWAETTERGATFLKLSLRFGEAYLQTPKGRRHLEGIVRGDIKERKLRARVLESLGDETDQSARFETPYQELESRAIELRHSMMQNPRMVLSVAKDGSLLLENDGVLVEGTAELSLLGLLKGPPPDCIDACPWLKDENQGRERYKAVNRDGASQYIERSFIKALLLSGKKEEAVPLGEGETKIVDTRRFFSGLSITRPDFLRVLEEEFRLRGRRQVKDDPFSLYLVGRERATGGSIRFPILGEICEVEWLKT